MSIQLSYHKLSLGNLDTNCYLVWCPKTLQTIIIDPADSGETIITSILDKKLQPHAILLTHGHFDHVLGLLELKLAFDLPIYLHQEDWTLLRQAKKSAQYWLNRQVDPVPEPNFALNSKSTIQIGEHTLTVIETPGHTQGSVCFFYAPHDHKDSNSGTLLFTGDTLFQGGVGRTDFSYSSPEKLEKSLIKLGQLPPNTLCLPGHGRSTTLSKELFPK